MYIIDKWDDNATITVSVRSGYPQDPSDIPYIKAYLEELKQHINLIFEFTDQPNADIRILLNKNVYNVSYIGKTNIQNVPKHRPNMLLDIHFGYHGNTESAVIHEFCHAIGCIHEHQRRDLPIS